MTENGDKFGQADSQRGWLYGAWRGKMKTGDSRIPKGEGKVGRLVTER